MGYNNKGVNSFLKIIRFNRTYSRPIFIYIFTPQVTTNSIILNKYRKIDKKSQEHFTFTACIALATSTFVFPRSDFPFTPTISSPACSVPFFAAGVLSNTWTTYNTGHSGAPPPIDIPIRFCLSFERVTVPGLPFNPLLRTALNVSKALRFIQYFLKTLLT